MAASAPHPIWGWTPPARALLTTIAVLSAIGLGLASRTARGPAPPIPDLVVDPNTAPPEVLGALPRLGPKTVERIVEARREAPFHTLNDLDARVSRIGPVTIRALRPYLRIGPDNGSSP